MNNMMRALLIVDLQNDFLPGGALPASDGNKIIPVVNLLQDHFELIIASRDWHPADTIHFQKWPVHCVQGSDGAAFPSELKQERIALEFLKGTRNIDDGYSAFEATNRQLDRYLRDQGVKEVVIAGLTTEYCVKNTVLDAIRAGFKTYVVKDAVAPVKAFPGEEEKAWEEMAKAGALVIDHQQITR
jgi:nicotinamidase/pyrazinamidase